MGIRLAGLAAVLAAFPLMLSSYAIGGAASALAGVRSWSYQLQGIDLRILAATHSDLLVIDYSRDGTVEGAFSAREIATLKTKPDGSRRFVLAARRSSRLLSSSAACSAVISIVGTRFDASAGAAGAYSSSEGSLLRRTAAAAAACSKSMP